MDAVGWHSAVADRFHAAYERSPRFVERRDVWLGLIETYATARSRVLDVGCGSGVLSMIAARRAQSVLGIDLSDEMLRIARDQAAQAGVSNVAYERHGFGDALEGVGSYDLVLCSSVIEYLPDLDEALAWLSRQVAPGGIILFSLPNAQSVYRRLERGLFAATGRPRYFRFVRTTSNVRAASRQAAACQLAVLDHRFFAPAPLLSQLLRPLGLRRYADLLFVLAARRV